jgi:SEC-C motif domain protein
MDHHSFAPETGCPCGSGHPYGDCCQQFHLGTPAATPEALMRTRYTAYVAGLADYLLATWHSSTRPRSLALDDSPHWVSLQVLSSGQAGDVGHVHFRAIHTADEGWRYLEEKSRFVCEEGRWFYVAGEVSSGVVKPGRNDPCPCGSGRKFKKCCSASG